MKLTAVMLSLQMVPLGMRLLHTMTEQEADNFGIFLREMLQSVMGWWVSHRDSMQDQSFSLKWKRSHLYCLANRPRVLSTRVGGAIACYAMQATYLQACQSSTSRDKCNLQRVLNTIHAIQ